MAMSAANGSATCQRQRALTLFQTVGVDLDTAADTSSHGTDFSSLVSQQIGMHLDLQETHCRSPRRPLCTTVVLSLFFLSRK